ncbi:hypothetical protein ACEU6E_10775 (plasmid) [Halorutilales archaeon Cl-col2-1]|nr:hypothetical protein [Halobacteria archaeon]
MSFSDDLKSSANAFEKVVYPEIEGEIDGNEIIPVENVHTESDVQKLLDTRAGIDALVRDEKGRLYGVASRVQYGADWGSFTVRGFRSSGSKTEYRKRIEEIEGDKHAIYPYYTCQAYVKEGRLLNAAVCKTQDLIEYIDQGDYQQDYDVKICNKDGDSLQTLFVVFWGDFVEEHDLYVHDASNLNSL